MSATTSSHSGSPASPASRLSTRPGRCDALLYVTTTTETARRVEARRTCVSPPRAGKGPQLPKPPTPSSKSVPAVPSLSRRLGRAALFDADRRPFPTVGDRSGGGGRLGPGDAVRGGLAQVLPAELVRLAHGGEPARRRHCGELLLVVVDVLVVCGAPGHHDGC